MLVRESQQGRSERAFSRMGNSAKTLKGKKLRIGIGVRRHNKLYTIL